MFGVLTQAYANNFVG